MESLLVEQPQVVQREKLRSEHYYLIFKRTVDIVVSSVALLVLLPFLMLIALTIKLTSKGEIIYWQKRVGLNGKEILFPKFRSMVSGADSLKGQIQSNNQHQLGHTFKMKKDPRITGIGKIIRKFSVDELPQLWLVLKGDMTLVGPRPALVSEVENYNDLEKQRLLVKPGLTCIWQVSGRGDLNFYEQLQMDVDYINKRSFLMDIKILIATVPAVITGRGAY